MLLDYLRWEGSPALTLKRPEGNGEFWRKAWVNGVSFFSKNFPTSFRISQSSGEGIVIHGTRDWTDYRVSTELRVHLANHAGVALRVQGLTRYYAVRFTRQNRLEIVRVRDQRTEVLAEKEFPFVMEEAIPVAASVTGRTIRATVGGVVIEAMDDSADAIACGGIGLLVHEGALSTDSVTVAPA
ncbi:hypothetical protein [Consotaella salsifontis]|uniref:hypothetical protein n=1 Tax=Consotaella salsifontis TaxID=1365950 RepID=UPI001FD95A80|nr:hypothetical protein [Consotaella salsifontis]